MTSTFVVNMEVVEILFLTLFICVSECRYVRKHHHSFAHDILNSLPPAESNGTFDNIEDKIGQMDDDAEYNWMFHGLNPKERLFKKDSSVTHHAVPVKTVPPLEQNRKIRNAIHKKLNNLRLKWAVANLESDLKELLDVVPDVDDNVQNSSSASTPTPVTGTTTIGVQTTPKPFPGEYQGYIPVTTAPSSYRLHSGNNQKHRRYIEDTDKRAHNKQEGRKHLKKMKRLVARRLSIIPNTAELKNHDAITKTLVTLNTNVLTGMLGIKKSLNSLSIHLRRALSTIGDISADNTNEERTDIKVNSDRIAQLQQGLEGKIDDIRYNITNLITTQHELAESMTWSLEKMIGMLSQMVDKVTSNERKLDDTDKHATTPAPSQEIVMVTNHQSNSDVSTHKGNISKQDKKSTGKSNTKQVKSKQKRLHKQNADVSTHKGNISKQDKKSTGKSNTKQVKSKQKRLHKEKERHSNTNTQNHSVKGKANDSRNGQPQFSRDKKLCLSKDRKDCLSRNRKHRLSKNRKDRLSRNRKHRLSKNRKDRLSRNRKHRPSKDRKDRLSPNRKHRLSKNRKDRLSRNRKHRPSKDRKDRLSPNRKHRLSKNRKDRLSRNRKHRPSKDRKDRLSPNRKHRLSKDRKDRQSPNRKHRLSRLRNHPFSRLRIHPFSPLRNHPFSHGRNRQHQHARKKASEVKIHP